MWGWVPGGMPGCGATSSLPTGVQASWGQDHLVCGKQRGGSGWSLKTQMLPVAVLLSVQTLSPSCGLLGGAGAARAPSPAATPRTLPEEPAPPGRKLGERVGASGSPRELAPPPL